MITKNLTATIDLVPRFAILKYPKEKLVINNPVIFAFHGHHGTWDQFEEQTRLSPLCEKTGYSIVYCQGFNNSWNDGRIEQNVSKASDLVYFDTMIAECAAAFKKINKSYGIGKIYVIGFSNGGCFCYHLYTYRRKAINAFVVSSCSMMDSGTVNIPPKPVLHFHGEKDLYVPINGGAGIYTNQHFIGAYATQRMIDKEGLFSLVPIKEGGHQWAGGRPITNLPNIGKCMLKPKQSELAIDFFNRN